MSALNLTTAKSFRQYVAIESVNHPEIHPAFVHAPPPGDAISPDSIPEFTATAATDLLATTGHGLAALTPIRFFTTGTLPAGLSLATTYYVIASGLTVDVFKVSATSGGSTVDITSTGTGTHTWSRYLTDYQAETISRLRSVSQIAANVTLPEDAIVTLTLAAWATYDSNPLHLAWVIDDYMQRHAQWKWRWADHMDAAAAVTPPSASGDGTVSHDPPTVPAGVSPN
jgi:hypothetical protein